VRLLLLGGPKFLGRAITDAALERLEHAAPVDGVGPSPEREAALLAEWHGRQ
jgi:hypothetical protein